MSLGHKVGIAVQYFVFLLCSKKLEECTVYFLKIVNTPLKGGRLNQGMSLLFYSVTCCVWIAKCTCITASFTCMMCVRQVHY